MTPPDLAERVRAAREIAQQINAHARECLIRIAPEYDVVDTGAALILALIERECARVRVETIEECATLARGVATEAALEECGSGDEYEWGYLEGRLDAEKLIRTLLESP